MFLSIMLMSTLWMSGGTASPAFIAINQTNESHQKVIADEAVLAFAQTDQGRIYFSNHGAFVGIPNSPDSMAVLQVGFSNTAHKKGIIPEIGQKHAAKLNILSGKKKRGDHQLETTETLKYPEVWQGIDLKFLTQGSKIAFHLILHPGARVQDVEMHTGADQLEIIDHSLKVHLAGADLHLSPPLAFQMIDGKRQLVDVAYKIKGNGEFGFHLGSYNPSHPLVIDPILSWSTFFGGSGSLGEFDMVRALAINPAKEIIFAGITNSPDFPVTSGVFDTTHNGDRDIFVGSLSSDGTSFKFMTFLGSNSSDQVEDLILDGEGNIYLTGFTTGIDFPVSTNAFDDSLSRRDAFITKLKPNGSDIIFSTLLGGSGRDTGLELVLDDSGNVLVFGETLSSDFPTTSGAFDQTLDGVSDGFLALLSTDGSNLIFSSFLGGSSSESINDAQRLADGSLLVTGTTRSSNFPTTNGAFSETLSGDSDIFVSILTEDGEDLLASTFLGGSVSEFSPVVDLDASGNIVVAGATQSNDFPTKGAVFDDTFNGRDDIVLVKFLPDLSAQIYGTFYGGTGAEALTAMQIDTSGNPVLFGYTNSSNLPTTVGSVSQALLGLEDLFVAKFDNLGANLTYGSYIGGSADDDTFGAAGAVDADGNMYLAGRTESTDFPATLSMRGGGNHEAFLVKVQAAGSAIAHAAIFGGGLSDEGNAIAFDQSGNIVIAGQTGTTSFPLTPGVVDDVLIKKEGFISKLDPTGSNLLLSTFLGGSGDDEIFAIAVDQSDQILVTGITRSVDFPTTPGALGTAIKGSQDIFVSKLSASADNLIYSTFLGGSSPFESPTALVLDSSGLAYVAGSTRSVDFPTTPGSFDQTQNGDSDAFVVKIAADGSSLLYGTFLGSSGLDSAEAMIIDDMGQVIVGGVTTPGPSKGDSGFPTTPGAFDESPNGASDGFITKLNASGSALIYSTYLGGPNNDAVTAIAMDAMTEAVVVGGYSGDGFPISAGVFDTTHNGSRDLFLASLNSSGSNLLFSTYLGGNDDDDVAAIAVESDGDMIVTGQTYSDDFPLTAGALVTNGDSTSNGYLAKVECGGTRLLYSTYLSGPSFDYITGMATQGDGIYHLIGNIRSSNFPTTAGVFDPNFSGEDEIVVIALDLSDRNTALASPGPMPRGLGAIVLDASISACNAEMLTVQWFNESAGTNFPLNQNPVNLTPLPTQTTVYRADITHPVSMETTSYSFTVLVSQNPLFFDFNGDGCNNIADLHLLADEWMTPMTDDPNGDGLIDIRDFLYINTSGTGTCP